jgi:ribonuclease HI
VSNVTLFTDASFCHKTGAAGWGAWAVCDSWQKSLVFGGAIQGAVTVNDAEMAGVAAALTQLAAEGRLADATFIVVQADNMRVLQMLAKFTDAQLAAAKDGVVEVPMRLRMSPMETAALDQFKAAVGEKPVWLRHVKGHNNGDGRHWVNSQCDREARGHMMSERRRMQGHG